MAKFQIRLKDTEAWEPQVENVSNNTGLSEDDIWDFLQQWVESGEDITIEFDTVKNTAKAVKV